MNQAWVTLLSSVDYLPAVLVLNKSLKENSQYSLVVAITDNIFNDVIYYIQQEQINYRKIETLEYTKFCQDILKEDSVLNTASKIGIFTLKDFDKLIYIDADTMFINNCDEIFNYPDGSMLYDGINWGDEIGGQSGLFCFVPKNHNYSFLHLIQSSCNCCDGNLLAYYLFPLKDNKNYQISSKYFTNYPRVAEDIEYFYIIHFEKKPWFYSSWEEYYKEYSSNLAKEVISQIYFFKYLYPIWEKYPKLKFLK